MSRESLISELRRYRERYPEEAETAGRIIQFVSANENCFHRSLSQGHITGSAWVVDRRGQRVLLTHHRKLNKWLQLGGHADGDSDVLAVAIREVEEESGLQRVTPAGRDIFEIDIHLIPESGKEPEHYHYDIRYLLRNDGSDDYIVSDESHDLGWKTPEELSELTEEESMLRMARKWRAEQAGP